MDCLGLLIRHFFGRFFDNELVSQHGDMRTNVVQAFGLVATPGLMVPFYMIPQRARFDHPFAWQLGAAQRLLFLHHVLHGGDGFRHGVRVGRAVSGPQGLPDSHAAAVGWRIYLRRQNARAGDLPGAIRGGCQLLLYAAGATCHRRRRHARAADLETDWRPRGDRAGRRHVRRFEYRERAGCADQSAHRARIPPRLAVGADGADERLDHRVVPDAAGLRRDPAVGGEPQPVAALVPAVLVPRAVSGHAARTAGRTGIP